MIISAGTAKQYEIDGILETYDIYRKDAGSSNMERLVRRCGQIIHFNKMCNNIF